METETKVLGVKRPEDDDDHPGMWGLPATSLDEGESWEDAVHRAAEKKLGVEVEIEHKRDEGYQCVTSSISCCGTTKWK